MKKLFKKLLDNRTLPVLKGTLKGTRLKVSELVSGSVFFENYEPDKQKVLKLLLGPKDVFFDIGANVGLHCYYVVKNFPFVTVYAFEPLPDNTAYMKEIVAANSFEHIEIIEAAVGAAPGESFFEMSDSNFSGRLSDGPTALRVKLTTLDEFTQERNIWPDVIKIDAESAESDVLNGAIQLVVHRPPVFIIELHNPTQDKLVADFFKEHNYTIFRINKDPNAPMAEMLVPIKNPSASWPDPNGVWGGIVAVHKKSSSLPLIANEHGTK